MKKNLLTLLLCLTTSTTCVLSQNNPKQNRNDIQDTSIVAPEHLNKQLATLLHDWQIDFSNSSNSCLHGTNIVYHDSVYTKRLFDLPTEMELSFNQVVKKYIEMYTERRREMVGYMLTVGEYYFPMFEEALDKEGLPLELKFLPVIESALNPIAVSRAGATGLWQFMLKTGQGYGLQVNSLVDERRDPYKSTAAAVKYLKDLFAIYEDWNLVIAAYNCGPGNVNKAIARSGGKRDYWEIYFQLPKETRGYVPAFIAANYIMNNFDKHNICPVETQTDMIALDTIHVNSQIHFNQIAEVLHIPITDIRRWNPQFKKDIIPGNYNNYALVLPTNKTLAFLGKQEEIANFNKNIHITHRENTDQYITQNSSTSSAGTTNVYYKVRKGDNLGKIASKYGVTVAQIKSWNKLKSNNISVGKSLIIKKKAVVNQTEIAQPTVAQNQNRESTSRIVNEYYRVKQGDNLGKIASRNGTTVAQLKLWNKISNDKLTVGKSLIVKKRVELTEQQPAEVAIDINAPEPISGYQIEQIELNVPKTVNIDSVTINIINEK